MIQVLRNIFRPADESGISISAWMCRFFSFFSLQDIAAIGGLTSLGYGLYLFSPPLSYIVIGSIVFILSTLQTVIKTLKGAK